MRDTRRIIPFLMEIGTLWAIHPDLRYGQLMTCFYSWLESKKIDPFYLEEKEFIEYLKIYTKEVIRHG